MKKLSIELQPYQKTLQVLEEIRLGIEKKDHLEIRLVLHAISYAHAQIGDRVLGRAYRERNGEHIDNWTVEIGTFIPLYGRLEDLYSRDESQSQMTRDNLSFPWYDKMLDVLKPWSIYFDVKFSSSRIDNLSEFQINGLLRLFFEAYSQISAIYIHKNQFGDANIQCKQALHYARLFKGKEEDKTDVLCKALKKYSELRRNERKFGGAITFIEEAYDLAAIAYNPVHSKVQEMASVLIELLINNGDLEKAELFSQDWKI